MPQDTKEQQADYVAGLLRERAGVVARDPDHRRVGEIDVELARFAAGGRPPVKRAETREGKTPGAEKRD